MLNLPLLNRLNDHCLGPFAMLFAMLLGSVLYTVVTPAQNTARLAALQVLALTCSVDLAGRICQ